MVWWRMNLKVAWNILAVDRKLQRVITWRMENQSMEEMWLMEALRKEERLQDAKKKKDKLKDREVENRWTRTMWERTRLWRWSSSKKSMRNLL